MPEIKIWPYYQVVYKQTSIRPGNELYKILRDFAIKTDHQVDVNLKKTPTFHRVDFVVPVEQRVKIKESEKIDKYFDFVREPSKTV